MVRILALMPTPARYSWRGEKKKRLSVDSFILWRFQTFAYYFNFDGAGRRKCQAADYRK